MALIIRVLSVLIGITMVLFVLVPAIAEDSYLHPQRNPDTIPGFQLFPPNAAISLTEDNSTFFPARPAAFGADLPDDGLSAALWIGAGFGEDGIEPQGELGCSDVPGWDGKRAADGAPVLPADDFLDDGTDNYLEDYSTSNYFRNLHKTVHAKAAITAAGRGGSGEAGDAGHPADAGVAAAAAPTATELVPGPKSKNQGPRKEASRKGKSRKGAGRGEVPHHSDIQSLQEGAEIAGKIVLLRRGGCGFLAKVMWAQRRGAVAVIVGDDRKGGPLIQMYASGDTSFVTIPSVFTAHTTAHLLSALVASAVLEDSLAGRKGADAETKTKFETATPDNTEASDGWFWKTRQREWVLDEYTPTDSAAPLTATGPAPTATSTRRPGTANMDNGRVLFVTIAPTGGSLPLIDTLLVVLASPLLAIIAITGVLIFIRTQCRYRAWRAPKAIVEQLPVHIYVPPGGPPPPPVMVPAGSSVASPMPSPPRSPSPPSFEPTITTPLLSRPRSRTTTGVPGDERRVTIILPPPPPHPPSRYFQAECVVCLEEYVAGDRVMSLPCGHEFHAACM